MKIAFTQVMAHFGRKLCERLFTTVIGYSVYMSTSFRRNRRPDAAAVMQRAIILKHVFVKALATPPAEITERWTEKERRDFNKQFTDAVSANHIQTLRANGLWPHLSQDERDFLQAGVAETTAQQRIDASWLAESMACLFWALGYLPRVPMYDEETSHDSIRNLPPFETAKIALENASLRERHVIDEQRDLAELWHWRCRTRRLFESGQLPTNFRDGTTMDAVIEMAATKASHSGAFAAPIAGDFPAFGRAFRDLSGTEFAIITSIAQERHRALNWLSGYAPGNRWAETPTHT